MISMKERPGDSKREYRNIWGLSSVLTTYFLSLKDRILAAGYDSADINYIGLRAVPGANVDKEFTEKCASLHFPHGGTC